MHPLKRLLWPLLLTAICALAFAARCWNLTDVFVAGRIYFVDADCYSRMTRAALIADGHGLVIRHHDFENFPHGTMPHTTAPLDWLIVAGKKITDLALRIVDRQGTSLLRDQTLDLAGALVSPLLGVLTCGWLGWWARRDCGPDTPSGAVCAWAAPLLFAVSPVLVHGTSLGRPDHQSLVVLLLAVALGAEWRISALLGKDEAPRPVSYGPNVAPLLLRWSIAAAVSWAAALWVSLYEPLVLLVVALVCWWVGNRWRFAARECRVGWSVFAGTLLVAVMIDGWRVVWPDPSARAAFAAWQTTIGELRHLDLRAPTLLQWLGALAVLSPFLLGLAARTDRRMAAVLALLLLLLGLTLWQLRWGYFLALVFAMSLPRQLGVVEQCLAAARNAAARRKGGLKAPGSAVAAGGKIAWFGAAVFLLTLWPVAKAWDAMLYPDRLAAKGREERSAEGVKLREVATRMRAAETGAFLAPWWLSPAIAYWSRQPGVAGSSHQALAGTMETARFYLTPDAATAETIARRLGVRWIVTDGADEDGVSRLVKAYGPLLGGAVPDSPWGVAMHERGHPRERASADDFRDASPELKAKLLALAERVELDELGSAAFTCVFTNQFFKLFRVKDAEPAMTP